MLPRTALTLLFDPLVAILLFLAVLIVNYAIQDGRSNVSTTSPCC